MKTAFYLLLLATTCLCAQQNGSATDEERTKRIVEAANKVAVHGPAQVKALDQATLDIPEGYVFIPAKESKDVMALMGNVKNAQTEGVVGMVLTQERGWEAFVYINYIKSGHVMDDDAKSWNADDLLARIKKGTEESNEARAKQGIPPLDVVGWIEKPSYEASTHHLIWSIEAKERGSTEKAQTVNYNTMALSREGMMRLLLVTATDAISQDKQITLTLLKGLKFNSGKRYEDFNKGTDQVAAYGLAALIAGVAAKKLGLLAVIGIFLLKIWKLSLLAIVIFWKRLKNLLTGKGWTVDPVPTKPSDGLPPSPNVPTQPPAPQNLPSAPETPDKK
jgi:uncharacterized membrane-anchored protein